MERQIPPGWLPVVRIHEKAIGGTLAQVMRGWDFQHSNGFGSLPKSIQRSFDTRWTVYLRNIRTL
jgi:hypothetical protein